MSQQKDLVSQIRANILEVRGSEAKAIATNEGLRELWKEKQRIIEEMNRAKKLAAEEAAKPFLAQIQEIDIQYAFLLQMIGDNKDDR